jgi:hypothetical protein
MRWNNSVTSVWAAGQWNTIVYEGGVGSVPEGNADGDSLSWDETGGGTWITVAASTLPTVVDAGTAPNTTLSWDNLTLRWIENLSVTIGATGVVTATGFAGPLTGDVEGDVVGNLTGTADVATNALACSGLSAEASDAFLLNGQVAAQLSVNTAVNATQLGTTPADKFPISNDVDLFVISATPPSGALATTVTFVTA